MVTPPSCGRIGVGTTLATVWLLVLTHSLPSLGSVMKQLAVHLGCRAFAFRGGPRTEQRCPRHDPICGAYRHPPPQRIDSSTTAAAVSQFHDGATVGRVHNNRRRRLRGHLQQAQDELDLRLDPILIVDAWRTTPAPQPLPPLLARQRHIVARLVQPGADDPFPRALGAYVISSGNNDCSQHQYDRSTRGPPQVVRQQLDFSRTHGRPVKSQIRHGIPSSPPSPSPCRCNVGRSVNVKGSITKKLHRRPGATTTSAVPGRPRPTPSPPTQQGACLCGLRSHVRRPARSRAATRSPSTKSTPQYMTNTYPQRPIRCQSGRWTDSFSSRFGLFQCGLS